MKIFKTCILVSKKGSQDIDVCGGKHFGALHLHTQPVISRWGRKLTVLALPDRVNLFFPSQKNDFNGNT